MDGSRGPVPESSKSGTSMPTRFACKRETDCRCHPSAGTGRGTFACRAKYPGQPLHGTSRAADRSEEHTSELQSLMRISYDVFCLNKTTNIFVNQYYLRYITYYLSPHTQSS